jgi:hypothetical protein
MPVSGPMQSGGAVALGSVHVGVLASESTNGRGVLILGDVHQTQGSAVAPHPAVAINGRIIQYMLWGRISGCLLAEILARC